MISADFYPSTATYCDGAVLCTNNITNIVVEENIEDIAKPYYIGYVKYDDMPKMCVPMFNRVDTISDDRIITFYQTPENHSWGFVRSNYSGTDSNRAKNMYYRTSLDSTYYSAQYTGENGLHKFLNKIEMCNHATCDKVTLGFHAFVVPIADIIDGTTQFKVAQSNGTYTLKTFNQVYDTNLGSNVVNLNILRDLINNNIPVMTGGTNIGGENLPYGEFYYSDFNEFGMAYKDTTNGIYRVFLWIDYIGIPGWGDYYDGNRHYGGSIEPFFEFTLEEVSGIYPEQTALYTPGQWTSRDFRINITNNVLRLTSTGMLNGYVTPVYVPYSISQNDLLNANIYWQRNGVVKNSYVLINAGGSGSDFSHYFYPHYDLKDIYKYLMFYHKIDTQGTTYQNITASDTYTTRYSTALFDSNDTPLYERVTEDYQTIVGKLRPWQMPNVDITVNEYDPADKPEYDPSGGGGGEPDEGDWGTSIIPFSQTTFGSTSFSRFELLNQAGVNELLGKLWAAPQSFWEGLSINKQLAANLNDYILSLRAYPVALNAGNAHNTIYIGASSGIDIQQGLFTPTLVNRIPLGALRISRQYNNFLDYNPYTSASIYLPFCGTVEINPKYLYDAALYLNLFVDCTDGSGVWTLVREGDDGKSFPILLRQCRVGVDIPITGLDTSQMASNIVNATIQTGQHALQTVNKVTGAAAQVGAAIATGGSIGVEGAANLATMGGSIALQGLADATNMAMANKEIPFYTSGSGGAAAAEGNTEPFITLRRPLVSNPSNFAHTVGNLVNKTATISSLNGFTVCRNVDVNGIGQATDKEKAQIKQILESGFYA